MRRYGQVDERGLPSDELFDAINLLAHQGDHPIIWTCKAPKAWHEFQSPSSEFKVISPRKAYLP